MAGPDQELLRHYAPDGLERRIAEALAAVGLGGDVPLPAEALNGLDEFHIGGAEATRDLASRLGLVPGMAVLDIGSGVGGPARLMARHFAVRVEGVDLTPEFVALAGALTARSGLAELVAFNVGSATALPFPDARFDVATLLHVGMNLPDKRTAFAEARRVLRPGGVFAIYDVMRAPGSAEELSYPLPWASGPGGSFLATAAGYREALAAAGFVLASEQDHRARALDTFARLRARGGRPPPLGLHLVMGPDAGEKVSNMAAALERGLIAPVEMHARA